MMNPEPRDDGPAPTALASLRRFVRPRAVREHCELCDAGWPTSTRTWSSRPPAGWPAPATPAPCSSAARPRARYRRVPRRVRFLPDFRLTDEAWDALQLPINLAFFLHSTPAGGVVALYPSPAGATESLVAAGGLGGPGGREPGAPRPRAGRRGPAGEPDRRVARATTASAIDECYKLVGLIRTHWRGLSGGAMVWGEIAGSSFDRSLRIGSESHA